MTIRIDLSEGASFGPGKARLLELVAETASLRQAAAAMEMSYRQAWLLIQAAEAAFGEPLVETATGGAGGGGSKLTELGGAVLAGYRSVEAKAAKFAAAELKSFAALARTGPAPGGKQRRLKPRKRS